LQYEFAVSPRCFDERNRAIRRKVASDGKVLQANVAGRVVVGVPAARGLEVGARDGGLHRGKSRAFRGIEQRGQQGILLRLVQGAHTHHPRFQECRAKAVYALQVRLVVDAKCRGTRGRGRLHRDAALECDPVACLRG